MKKKQVPDEFVVGAIVKVLTKDIEGTIKKVEYSAKYMDNIFHISEKESGRHHVHLSADLKRIG